MYIDSILNPIVKPWLEDIKRGRIDPLTLEEDGDSGHGGGTARNPVRIWNEKKRFGVVYQLPFIPRSQSY